MERKLKDYAVLMLKGMGMGAADVVPGVSGGTIAFIVGIYDELINSIKSINGESLKLFFTGKWIAFCKQINAAFLFPRIHRRITIIRNTTHPAVLYKLRIDFIDFSTLNT